MTEVPEDQHFVYNQMFKYVVKYKKDGGTVTEVNQLPTQKRCKKAILKFLLDHLRLMAESAHKQKIVSEKKLRILHDNANAIIGNRQVHYSCDMMAFRRYNNLIPRERFSDLTVQ